MEVQSLGTEGGINTIVPKVKPLLIASTVARRPAATANLEGWGPFLAGDFRYMQLSNLWYIPVSVNY